MKESKVRRTALHIRCGIPSAKNEAAAFAGRCGSRAAILEASRWPRIFPQNVLALKLEQIHTRTESTACAAAARRAGRTGTRRGSAGRPPALAPKAFPDLREESPSVLRERAGKELRRKIEDRHYAIVSHACGPDHADRADDLTVHLVGRSHHAHIVGRADAGFAADEDLHALAAQGKIQDLQQGGLALEELQHLLQPADVLRQVAHCEQVALARDHVLLAALRERGPRLQSRA